MWESQEVKEKQKAGRGRRKEIRRKKDVRRDKRFREQERSEKNTDERKYGHIEDVSSYPTILGRGGARYCQATPF